MAEALVTCFLALCLHVTIRIPQDLLFFLLLHLLLLLVLLAPSKSNACFATPNPSRFSRLLSLGLGLRFTRRPFALRTSLHLQLHVGHPHFIYCRSPLCCSSCRQKHNRRHRHSASTRITLTHATRRTGASSFGYYVRLRLLCLRLRLNLNYRGVMYV